MAGITNEKLLKNIPNNFILVIVSTERMKELKKGARALVDIESKDPYEIMVKEIEEGKLSYRYESEG